MPAIDSFAEALVLVGLLFALRYFLVMRRIWQRAGRPQGFVFGDYWRATKPGAFGSELEPDRRYAARQLYLALACLVVGLLLAAWLLIGRFEAPAVT